MMVEPAVTPTKKRLLDTASSLFYSEGIHAVGIGRIIKEANVAKATLYAHYSGKDDLVAAYLLQRSEEWQKWIDTSLPAYGPNPIDRITGVFLLLQQRFMEPDYRGCPFINASAEFPSPGIVFDRIKSHRNRVKDTFLSLLKQTEIYEYDTLLDSLMVIYDGALVAAQYDKGPMASNAAYMATKRLLQCNETQP